MSRKQKPKYPDGQTERQMRRTQKDVDETRRGPHYAGVDPPGGQWPMAVEFADQVDNGLSRLADQLRLWLEGRHEPLSDAELEHWIKAEPMVARLRQENYNRLYEHWWARRPDEETPQWEKVNWAENQPRPPRHWDTVQWCLYRILSGYRPDGARADTEGPCRCPWHLSQRG
jgi:hypothetical protein